MIQKKPEFVLLEGIIPENKGNKFFSTNNSDNPTKSFKGETWYKVLGYAETVSEAQTKLFGRSFA